VLMQEPQPCQPHIMQCQGQDRWEPANSQVLLQMEAGVVDMNHMHSRASCAFLDQEVGGCLGINWAPSTRIEADKPVAWILHSILPT